MKRMTDRLDKTLEQITEQIQTLINAYLAVEKDPARMRDEVAKLQPLIKDVTQRLGIETEGLTTHNVMRKIVDCIERQHMALDQFRTEAQYLNALQSHLESEAEAKSN